MKLFVFGLGYAARAFVRAHGARFQSVAATIREQANGGEGAARLHDFSSGALDAAALADLAEATHWLVSIPADADGDAALRACAPLIGRDLSCRWIGYLSSVAVYGDHGGAWIDEKAALKAASARGRWRVATEKAWVDCGARIGAAAHLFRLAGVYGPGRNAFVNLRTGRAKRLVKPGQIFNRVHVDDIADIVAATLDRSDSGAWNVADDEPAPPQDVVEFAAALMGVAPPPEIPFDAAALTPMAASFYADCKRVSNARAKRELGVALRYPTYREGLRALLAVETETKEKLSRSG